MGTIKFRAWTGLKMIFRGLHDRNWYTEDLGGKLVKTTHPDDIRLEVMQFTGLTDKNGKEIYEGDVVIHGIIKQKSTIVFIDGSFAINDEKSRHNACLRHYAISEIEVIGNIYENS